jgi:hypothetical protein
MASGGKSDSNSTGNYNCNGNGNCNCNGNGNCNGEIQGFFAALRMTRFVACSIHGQRR